MWYSTIAVMGGGLSGELLMNLCVGLLGCKRSDKSNAGLSRIQREIDDRQYFPHMPLKCARNRSHTGVQLRA